MGMETEVLRSGSVTARGFKSPIRETAMKATRKEAEALWAGTVLAQPILWDGPVAMAKQAKHERESNSLPNYSMPSTRNCPNPRTKEIT